jgi:lipopolysaccharide/colanic/teichoic acid biosynthesis glycosyltransferase
MKRLFDVALAGAGLVLLSPVLVVAAIATLIDSGRPILYRQIRVGRSFKPFTLYKFRTMGISVDEPGVTIGEDSRITRVGQFLRATKVDETPQLMNVVRGDMSLVGPRPELPRYVELFREAYETILTVRPGITDPASIKYRDESRMFPAGVDPDRFYQEEILPDKIAIAQSYVANRSMRSDFRIIVQTIARLFSH